MQKPIPYPATMQYPDNSLADTKALLPQKDRLMHLNWPALAHLAALLLEQFVTKGCLVDTGPSWSIGQIQAVFLQGVHPSACTPDAQATTIAEIK